MRGVAAPSLLPVNGAGRFLSSADASGMRFDLIRSPLLVRRAVYL